MAPIVILGSGLAGYAVARELRKLKPDAAIEMITSDDGAFYPKPQISTALAKGKTAAQLVTTPAEKMSAQLSMPIHTRTRVLEIDRTRRMIRTEGAEKAYSKLILALGADPVRPKLAGDAADEVLSVNALWHYETFRQRLAQANRVVIMGGGLIGCEFANDLASVGIDVTVVETTGWPLSALAPRSIGAVVATALESAGVIWRFHRTVVAVSRGENGYRVTLDDGQELGADLVLSAVGLRAHTKLAEQAGLHVGRGVIVDAAGVTSDPDILALGDCAEYPSGTHFYVTPIMAAARGVARTAIGDIGKIEFPVLSVLVKTTVLPVVLMPPSGAGAWLEPEGEGDDLTARFIRADGRFAGYALTGAKCTLRSDFDRDLLLVRETAERAG